MRISQISPVTGNMNTMDLPISLAQLSEWKNGGLIQNVMPHLDPDEREFLISGCAPGDWDLMFSAEE